MLYIVGTPIGNLEDISMRALRILKEVDFILCEDTRVTKRLLDNYNIKTKTISYHQHTGIEKQDRILTLLKENNDLALVTDAGTPGISDPGGKLVQAVLEELPEVNIESVPGPSAVTAALSISGIPTDRFVFMGFPPHKKGRQKFIDKIFHSEFPCVVYESKHRILKLLAEVNTKNQILEEKNSGLDEKEKYFKKNDREKRIYPVTSIVVCREISKMHETVYRGEIGHIMDKISLNKDDQRGEFVVIFAK